jgi:hypothetical protein
MTELYVFRGTTGHAEMVTDDKSGKKLPPHSCGEWVFSKTINVAGEMHVMGGANCAQVLANVVKDGFHHWPELESDLPLEPPVRPPICLPISPTSRKTRTPSCSRLLNLARPQTRLRARRLLRPNPKLRAKKRSLAPHRSSPGARLFWRGTRPGARKSRPSRFKLGGAFQLFRE